MDNTIDFIEAKIKIFVETIRPPKEIRDKVDFGFTYQKSVLELFEIRPKWDKPQEKTQTPVAKTRFIKANEVWRIYWMRANGKWELYEPRSEVKIIDEFFEVIKEDKHGCFFG